MMKIEWFSLSVCKVKIVMRPYHFYTQHYFLLSLSPVVDALTKKLLFSILSVT
jgi:hypothetical protein